MDTPQDTFAQQSAEPFSKAAESISELEDRIRFPWFERLIERIDTPWMILPIFFAITHFYPLIYWIFSLRFSIWVAVPTLCSAGLLILWATARYGHKAMAPSISLMALNSFAVSVGSVSLSLTNALYIPILWLVMRYGLSPAEISSRWISSKRSTFDIIALLFVSALTVSATREGVSFDFSGGGLFFLVLLFFIGPRPLWPVLLYGALFFAVSHYLDLRLELDSDVGRLRIDMRVFPFHILLAPLFALIGIRVIRRLFVNHYLVQQTSISAYSWTEYFANVLIFRAMFWFILFAFSQVQFGTMQIPRLDWNLSFSSWIVDGTVLAILIVFAAGHESTHTSSRGYRYWLQASAMPIALAGMGIYLNYETLVTLFGETIFNTLELPFGMRISLRGNGFDADQSLVFAYLFGVVHILLLHGLTTMAFRALGRFGDTWEESVLAEAQYNPHMEAGRLKQVFGPRCLRVLFAGCLVLALALAALSITRFLTTPVLSPIDPPVIEDLKMADDTSQDQPTPSTDQAAPIPPLDTTPVDEDADPNQAASSTGGLSSRTIERPIPTEEEDAGPNSIALIPPVAGQWVQRYDPPTSTGIFIAALSGDEVRAAADGEIAIITGLMSEDETNIIIIRHANNLLTVYAEVDKVLVEKGDNVQQGDPIATVPFAENSPTSNVLFELRDGLDAVDPAAFLDQVSGN